MGDAALNKPADLAESRAILRRLSEREHTVYTVVCLVCLERDLQEEADITARVRLVTLSEADITRYQSLVNILDKARSIDESEVIKTEGTPGSISAIAGAKPTCGGSGAGPGGQSRAAACFGTLGHVRFAPAQ